MDSKEDKIYIIAFFHEGKELWQKGELGTS
jgi:hypothetical protein